MPKQNMDEIAKQARQGSVAAIVQIMNDRLSDMGVRTRAVLEKGILQVLCEAKKSEPLEQSTLIARLREILEAIEPRNLRRVKICSRIAREQQLVWLEDIHRNPENEVLWCQEIVLRKPNIWHKLFPKPKSDRQNRDRQNNLSEEARPNKTPTSTPPSSPIPTRMRNGLGMVALCTVSFLAGLAYNNWREQNFDFSQLAELFPFLKSPVSSVSPAAPIVQPTASPASQTDAPPVANSHTPSDPPPTRKANPDIIILPTPGTATTPTVTADPFAAAVRLAEEVSLKGQTAQTEAEWLNLSAQWTKASELMKSVSADDPRYSTARDRVVFYQKNSEVARARAKEQQQ
ncbi:MAG: hypothetical protein AB4290_14165 [Spirulina sp.]